MIKKLLSSNYSLLIAILIIAAFFRFYNITQLPPGLYPDEAMNGNNALEALSPTGHFKVFYPENNGREGLFMNIQALSIYAFGNEPWALRVASSIFGILTVLGVYFLTKELFAKIPNSQLPITNEISNEQNKKSFGNWKLEIENSEVIALLSAFFVATSFWHINFSRIGFRAIMAPFFAVWAFYFLLLALNKIRSLNPKFYILYSILGGVFLGLGFHSYIAFRAMPALAIIIWILYWIKNKEGVARKKILLSAFYFMLSAIIMFAPLGWYFLKNPKNFMGRTTQVSIMSSGAPLKNLSLNVLKTAGMFFYKGDNNWRHNLADKPELFWLIEILFLIGIIISVRRLFSTETGRSSAPAAEAAPGSRPDPADSVGDQAGRGFETFRTKTGDGFLQPIILFSWLIIAALPVVISNEGIPHALRAIIMIPPVFILAGLGGAWIYEKVIKNRPDSGVRKIIINSALIAILILLIMETGIAYFDKWGKNPEIQGAFAANYTLIGRELRDLPKEMIKYVIVEAGGTDVRGIPMPSQTVMFLTDTFTPEKQKDKNLFYVLPEQINQIPKNAYVVKLK
ncbi:hypothetical protein HY227_01660 [Candidatus Wolfebacteria bacterium]|nr:hypothetical protein [Candidatus Wolfebacteria bacterium]